MPQHRKRVPDNDGFCIWCRDGGDLICCDECVVSYHQECLGIYSRGWKSCLCIGRTCSTRSRALTLKDITVAKFSPVGELRFVWDSRSEHFNAFNVNQHMIQREEVVELDRYILNFLPAELCAVFGKENSVKLYGRISDLVIPRCSQFTERFLRCQVCVPVKSGKSKGVPVLAISSAVLLLPLQSPLILAYHSMSKLLLSDKSSSKDQGLYFDLMTGETCQSPPHSQFFEISLFGTMDFSPNSPSSPEFATRFDIIPHKLW